MKRCSMRLGLSLILAMGWWVQRLPAQTPTAPPPAVPEQAPCRGCALNSDAPAGPQAGTQKRFIHKALNHFGLGCWTTHNSPGCGSLYSNVRFVFGSCHSFYGEPCLAAPPKGMGLGR